MSALDRFSDSSRTSREVEFARLGHRPDYSITSSARTKAAIGLIEQIFGVNEQIQGGVPTKGSRTRLSSLIYHSTDAATGVRGTMRIVAILTAAALCAGCAGSETVRFVAKPQQQALMRDGQAALVSRGKSSLVLVRPAGRQFKSGNRPVFVVGINNMAATPLDFKVANIQVAQVVGDRTIGLKVVTYNELVGEERGRQVARALLVGLAAGANAVSASHAGNYSSDSTVTTPRGGMYQVHTTGYSPTAAAIAQSNAAAQNEAMVASTIEQGQANLAALERLVIKDNTLMPGEWYGGQLHLEAPASASSGAAKTYSIALLVGSDRHHIEVVQERQ
jgi:hypothetical protein